MRTSEGGTEYAIDPDSGQIVPVTSGSVTGGVGGPSPGVRDNPGTESYPTQPDDGGTIGNAPKPGDPGGPPSSDPSANPQLDWRAYLSDWGFPPDVVDELDRIFKTYSDPSQAGAAALAYIRGTDWYKKTFAGIGEGIKNGLFSDEAGYRAYVNQANQYYQRYFGRNVTTQEVSDFLTKGWNTNQIDSHFQGQAYVAANRDQIQYGLGAFGDGQASEQELAAFGDQYGGLDNMLGPQVQKKIQVAQQRLQRIVQGTLATPALSVLGSGGLAASSLGAKNPDYAA